MNVETVKIIEWALAHPKRNLAFGNGDDLSIACVFGTEGNHCHAVLKEDGSPGGLIVYTKDEINRNLEIKHLIADHSVLHTFVSAWQLYYPDYTVSGRRSRSGKIVKHALANF